MQIATVYSQCKPDLKELAGASIFWLSAYEYLVGHRLDIKFEI